MKRVEYVIFMLFAFIMFSCSNEDNDTERHIMKDGKVVYTYPDVKFYGDKESFRDAVLENREHNDSVKDDLERHKDSLYGYNGELKYDKWEKAKFGSWISDYGLTPGAVYFVSAVKVLKYIPATYEDWVVTGEYFTHDEDSIGAYADYNNGKVGFVLNPNMSYGYYEATTFVKCISYDVEGNTVGVYFPVSPDKLKWKFFKTKAIW